MHGLLRQLMNVDHRPAAPRRRLDLATLDCRSDLAAPSMVTRASPCRKMERMRSVALRSSMFVHLAGIKMNIYSKRERIKGSLRLCQK